MGKKNNNNVNLGNYYMGLDVGTNSAGWAATDFEYNLLKFHGKHMWGARLFEEAKTSEERRTNRSNRRRIARRNQRLQWLEMLFNPLICENDPEFFIRLKDSYYQLEDKNNKECKYSLFNDADFTDKDYFKKYPTIYHLRSELVHSKEFHDPRLVYLALHHMLKHRGHFLFSSTEGTEEGNINDALDELSSFLDEEYGVEFKLKDSKKFVECLSSKMNLRDKKIEIKNVYKYDKQSDDNENLSISSLLEMLTGASVKFKDLFKDDEFKNVDLKGITLKDDIDENAERILDAIGDDGFELIEYLKTIYDLSRLSEILGDNEYLSDSKVELFNKNKKDLCLLKDYVKKEYPDKYNLIFNDDVKNNYVKYSKYKINGTCSQEDFCSFLKKELPNMQKSEDQEYIRIWNEIVDSEFLPKLKSKENSVVPYQVHLKELNRILENASNYLPIGDKGDDGLSIADKVKSIFSFRIPYYVGPLNKNSDKAWLSRTNEVIYPWNFEKVVDLNQSANDFMEKLIGKCTYTNNNVLPFNSLLYSKYMVLNEINTIQVNGHLLDVKTKQDIYNDLFLNNNRKVTKKTINNYLKSKGLIDSENDTISGIDDTVKSNLKSYHDFKFLLGSKLSNQEVEEIIQRIIVFGDDKNKLKQWLSKFESLNNDDIKSICRLNYKDWGRLSKTFLNLIEAVNENGEVVTIIDELWNTNKNLMQIINASSDNNPTFIEVANEYKKEKYGVNCSADERLDDMYISPKVRRSIRQTLRIVDEIVDIKKSAPKKIFIEMARTNSKELKGKRTESRKNKLLELYKNCGKDNLDIYDRLKEETDQRLRREKLYLYYTQFGRCMYSGELIDDLDSLFIESDNTYDVDHIFPRSKIKDDSLDNKVLVKGTLNRDKTDVYPINENVRTKMGSYWKMLHEKGLISDKKYERLIRNYPLTEEELSSFVARQLVETQQSTKALAEVLKELYPNTKIVYSKAGNVSDFRHEFDIPKFRNINDLHHAKDAYLNIVVGNVYDTKFTAAFFKNIEKENYSLNRVFDFDTKGAWVAKGGSKTIEVVKKQMRYNDVSITIMPIERKGSIFAKVTLQKAGTGKMEIKRGLDINKYGGYPSLSCSYFTVVEFTKNGKRVRAILPVELYASKLFEENPVTYCKDVLNLTEPTIIVKKVPVNSMIEFDGVKKIITGKSESTLLVIHAYQFILDDEKSKYLKYCEKYLEIFNLEKKEIEPRNKDLISKNGNLEMYDYLNSRLSSNPYNNLFLNISDELTKRRNLFDELELSNQAKVLINILNAFKCDRNFIDLSLIGAGSSLGNIRQNSNITKLKSCYLINQSVTGLFEYKIDLLK